MIGSLVFASCGSCRGGEADRTGDRRRDEETNGGSNVRVYAAPCNGDCECANGIDDDGDGLVDWQLDLGCTSRNDGTEGGKKTGVIEDGWTVFEPSRDARIIYVSDSVGQDAYDGLAPDPGDGSSGPKKTIAAGLRELRAGMGDWLLLRRGDGWSGGLRLERSGPSAEAPVVIASYGESLARPVLNGDINVKGSSHVAIAHLEARLPMNEMSASGVDASNTTSVLVEGCHVQQALHSLVAIEGSSLRLRRNVAMNANDSAIFMSGINGLLIDGTVIVRPARNHGMYLTTTNEGVETRENLVLIERDTGNGIMQRPGGVADSNVIVGCGWAGLALNGCDGDEDTDCNNGEDSARNSATITNNVVLEGRPMQLGGIELRGSSTLPGALVSGNVAVRATLHTSGTDAVWENNLMLDSVLLMDRGQGQIWRNNVVYGTVDDYLVSADHLPTVSGFVAQGNRFYATGRSAERWFRMPQDAGFSGWQRATNETGSGDEFKLKNADCSLAGYQRSFGGAATTDAFFEGAALQAKFRWDPAYAAPAVVKYFKDALTIVP